MSLDIMRSVDRFCINRENGTDGMDKNGGEMSGYYSKEIAVESFEYCELANKWVWLVSHTCVE